MCLDALVEERTIRKVDVAFSRPTSSTSSPGDDPTLVVEVEHDPHRVTARGIADVIRKGLLAATDADSSADSVVVAITTDGGDDGMWAWEDAVQRGASNAHVAEKPATESSAGMIPVRWNVLLAGALWAVSFFSYFGGRAEGLKYAAIAS